MDKYPVLENGTAAGELTVCREALYTAFDVACPLRAGLWCAWAVGETGALRIGVVEPREGALRIRRRFSQTLTAPVGHILHGELRLLSQERTCWTPLAPDALPFHDPYLLRCLRGRCGLLTCGTAQRRFLAVPRDDTAPFPLEAMFCFACCRTLRGQPYWVFTFDGQEWPVF